MPFHYFKYIFEKKMQNIAIIIDFTIVVIIQLMCGYRQCLNWKKN